MKGLIQRVLSARVDIEGECVGAIDQGLLLLLGIEKGDNEKQADKMVDKVLSYRVFSDDNKRMNLNVGEIGGGVLVVSQFTLAADTRKGLRPGFSSAEKPELAEKLYDYFVRRMSQSHQQVETGRFSADMRITLCNDGPVTFMLES